MDSPQLQPRRVPIADLTAENLKILVEDMGLEPGHHPSADLYGWYVGMAQEAELEPVGRVQFGASLKALGYRATVIRRSGEPARCWFLSRRAWRDTAPSTGQPS